MTPPNAAALEDLARRVEALTSKCNAIDVEVEIALFEPCDNLADIRANQAGTKVIYTFGDGSCSTFWPDDWTLTEVERAETAAALRARAATLTKGPSHE